MTEQKSPAELAAEASSEDTRSFVRRATRRKYTPEEKVRIVLEGFRGEIGISTLCRREGIHPTVYYAWLKDFTEAEKARLHVDSARDATRAEVEVLKRERDQLKQLVAELSLQVHMLKKQPCPASTEEAIPADDSAREGTGAGHGGSLTLVSARSLAFPGDRGGYLLPVEAVAVDGE